jgi:transposase InsO family protein
VGEPAVAHDVGPRDEHLAAGLLDRRQANHSYHPIQGASLLGNHSRAGASWPWGCGQPRSPKLHGAVERANRTHTAEFYEVTTAEPELESFQVELRAWEIVYNTIRPHKALGYLTLPNIWPPPASM